MNLRLLRQIILALLKDLLPLQSFELGVCLVGPAEMTRLNETFLRHAGSTDVITFDYALRPNADELHGEILICLEEAVTQARRFHTTWPAEVVRYAVHGILHLRGHDDLKPVARRKMKSEEDGLVRELARRFNFGKLEGKARS